MIKLIATDLDGTLLNSKGEIDPEIYDIVRQLKEMGILFAAASGRQFESIKRKFEPVIDDIICIAENGAYVTYKGEDVYLNTMDKEVIREIVDLSKQAKDTALFVCGKKYCYADLKGMADFLEQPAFGYKVKLVDDLKELDDDIFKIGLCDVVDPRENSLKIMGDRLKGRVHMTLSGFNTLDFLNLDANKGEAIKSIREKFGINKEEIVVFGDNFNDVEMFDEAGVSYAMLDADEYVKSRATHVTGSNDDNSVIKVLKQIIKEIG